jgi:hypothetical protein
MSFDEQSQLDGRGRAILLNFSIDSFTTILARYGTHSGKLNGTDFYEPRVVSVGTLSRGFGPDRIAAAGAVDVVIENTDGVADWLASRDGASDLAKLRVKIYVALFDPDYPSTVHTTQLGEFALANWPKRNNTSIELSLIDDIFNALNQPCILPTPVSWFGTGTIATNPLKDFFAASDLTLLRTPIQLAFGEDWVRCHEPLLPHTTNSAWRSRSYSYGGAPVSYATACMVVPICSSAYDVTVRTSEVTQVRIVVRDPNGGVTPASATLEVPNTFNRTIQHGEAHPQIWTVWTAKRSDTITVDGRSMRVVWLEVDIAAFAWWALQNQVDACRWGPLFRQYATGATPGTRVGNPDWEWFPPTYDTTGLDMRPAGDWAIYYKGAASRVAEWYVKGIPLSARTQVSDRAQHACDVLSDLATYYAKPAIPVSSSSYAIARTSSQASRCSGVIAGYSGGPNSAGWGPSEPPKPMRAAVSAICQSSDIDVFINKGGSLCFSHYSNDATIFDAIANDTLRRIDEERFVSFEDWMPSDGERGALYNHVTLDGGRPNWAEGRDVPSQGPWTLDATHPVDIASTTKLLPVTLQQGWRPWEQTIGDPLQWRHLEIHARSRVRFVTDLSALRLELGEFFRLTWGRNVSPPVYDDAVFQVEAISYSPDTDSVEVEAIWRNDVVTERGYLLDNQGYLLVVASSGGRTATVADSSNVVTFSSGDLNANGVVAGDTLVLLDATQGDAEFSRFRALLVSDVTSTTTLEVDDADLDFGGGLAVATWEIRRGATTYPTSITDPTNYPTGGEMYGKVTDEGTELYTDGSGPNYLLDG